MKKLVAVGLLLLVGAAYGQDKQEKQNQCPIVFESVKPYFRLANGSNFLVTFRNNTDKEIVGLKFQAAFYDSTNDLHVVPETWTASDKTKPGKRAWDSWEDNYYMNTYGWKSTVDIWPVKLLFVDGSVWEDDSSHSCKVNSKNNGKEISGNFEKKS